MTDTLPSAWTPFRSPVFRILWAGWLISNLCMWMNDVAAAWLMTSLSTSPLMVALVQTASTFPVFILGVPSGALADIVDRRSILIFTQFWLMATAILLCVTTLTNTLSPGVLLALTFANGVGLALRWPAYAATLPDLVDRKELPAAIALNAVSMNTSRIFGPIAAGALIATVGTGWVFALNAGLAVMTAVMLLRWRRERKQSELPSERFFAAMRVGLQHMRQSPGMHAILARTALFFLHSMGLIALLPLIARGFASERGAESYTLLLASMGAGAIAMVPILPRLRARFSRDQLVTGGTLIVGAAIAAMAFAPNVYVGVACMFVAGFVWIAVANTLAVAAQVALPDWARARGMAIFQTSMMGASAIGAAIWGQVATSTSVPTALVICAASCIVTVAAARALRVGGGAEEDLEPARLWKAPELAISVEPRQGPVLVTIEYEVDAADEQAFHEAMRESRRSWLANGLLAWELYMDVTHPGRYIEHLTDESWAEYVRRNERVTASYLALRDRKHAFHRGSGAPTVRRYVAKRPERRST